MSRITKPPPKVPPAQSPRAAYGQRPGAPGGQQRGGPGAAWHLRSCREVSCEWCPKSPHLWALPREVVWHLRWNLSRQARPRGLYLRWHRGEGPSDRGSGGPSKSERGGMTEKKIHQTRDQDTWVLVWFLPLTCCMTLGKFLPLSRPIFWVVFFFLVWDRIGVSKVSSSPKHAELGENEHIWSGFQSQVCHHTPCSFGWLTSSPWASVSPVCNRGSESLIKP